MGPNQTIRVEDAIDNRCRIADQYQNISSAKWQGALASDDLMRITLSGIEYYRRLAGQIVEEKRGRFLDDLKELYEAIDRIPLTAKV